MFNDYPVGDVKEPGSTAESEGEDVFIFSWRNGDGCCRDMGSRQRFNAKALKH